MNRVSNEMVSVRLTQALDKWFQRAVRIGAYLEYQIEGIVAGQDDGEMRVVQLLDEILPGVAETCRDLDEADRWISLHVSIQPETLLLECSSAGKCHLESGRLPESAMSMQLIQCKDSYQLRVKMER